jgi:hypothetical protein
MKHPWGVFGALSTHVTFLLFLGFALIWEFGFSPPKTYIAIVALTAVNVVAIIGIIRRLYWARILSICFFAIYVIFNIEEWFEF